MKLIDLDLEVYQGPFDLLFTLILKEEVDIFEVSLLDVITAYLEEMAQGETEDWESLSEFIVLIGSLLHVKVSRLLPGQAQEDAGDVLSPEEAREQLVARLLQYQRIKGAAAHLRGRALDQCGRLTRPVGLPPLSRLCPVDEVRPSENPLDLVVRLQALLEAHREPDTTHLPPLGVELKRQLAVLRSMLTKEGRVSFNASFGRDEPLLQAVTLLAVLELLARGEVEAAQAAPFSDIHLRGLRRG